MVNVFYGRENLDKERFMYEHIKGKTLIIVPDQYTLEAEKQAFRYLKTPGLMDVEIISMSRLGHRLLNKMGGGKATFIDKYGRHILLNKILREERDNLLVFNGTEDKNSFAKLMNNLISQMKQFNASYQELDLIRESLPEGNLRNKLADVVKICKRYDEHIEGKYTDSEDYIDLYLGNIKDSEEIQDSEIWIYGYDSFAPKSLDVIKEIMATSPNTNIILTYSEKGRDADLFKLTAVVKENLENCANEKNLEFNCQAIGQEYIIQGINPAMSHIEQELYSMPYHEGKEAQDITFVEAANPYNEAESAAAFIMGLVRDRGYRYRDILVICNDQNARASIIQRVFQEYGIKIFVDKKKSIAHSQVVILILSLLEICEHGFRTRDVLDYLKSGFSNLTTSQVEDLENYGIKYRMKGTMWTRELFMGRGEYGDQGLEELEELRRSAIEPLMKLNQRVKDSKSVRDFAIDFYNFLNENMALPSKITELVQLQEDTMGQIGQELAEETKQVWGSIIGIMEQIVALLGDDAFAIDEFVQVLKAGLETVELGVLPPTADGIIMGTTQRSRVGKIKAEIILGANEGLLPNEPEDDALFSNDELEQIKEQGVQIGKIEAVRSEEEKLAIYRDFAKPSLVLWISYCTTDNDGTVLKPSSIFNKLKKIFPQIEVQKDILNQDNPMNLVGGYLSTLKHMTQSLQNCVKGASLDPVWKEAMLWYQGQRELDIIKSGIGFTNSPRKMGREEADELYMRGGASDLTISPSRIEKFSRCPFAHFINYGLRPEERRVFQVAAREVGDLYHNTLMEYFESLTQEGVEIRDEASKWMTITKEESDELVTTIAKEQFQGYREGLFQVGAEEEYRAGRLIEICKEMAWTLIEQARAGAIESCGFEAEFGKGKSLDAIEIPISNGTVYIEGKIDRVDYMPGDRVKIIDYKTGNEVFDINEAESGYRLQLMLYLKAAQGKTKLPAGVFYFLIKQPEGNVSGYTQEEIENKLKKELNRSYKMNGLLVGNEEVINALDSTFEKYSSVVPVQKTKEGYKGSILSEENFLRLQKTIDDKLVQLCQDIADGSLEIKPMKTRTRSACTYCQYTGICRFDVAFQGNNYKNI